MNSLFFTISVIVTLTCQIQSLKLAKANPLTLVEADTKLTQMQKLANKTFFQTARDDLNWMDAEAECQTFGLQFAKLETKEEFDYVQEQLPMTEIWVGGKLKKQEINGGNNDETRGAFEWNDGSSIPDSESGVNFQIELRNWMCIYFYKHVLYPGQCTQTRKALCQLIL